MNNNRIELLSKALATIYDERFDGFVIAKAKVKFMNDITKRDVDLKQLNIKATIIRDTDKFKICLVAIFLERMELSQIEVNLMQVRKQESNNQQVINGVEGDKFNIIDKNEIYSFAREVGDLNQIHFTDTPIVQGMLLLKYIDEYLIRLKYKFNILEVRFKEPLLASQESRIKICGDEFELVKGNVLILKGVMRSI